MPDEPNLELLVTKRDFEHVVAPPCARNKNARLAAAFHETGLDALEFFNKNVSVEELRMLW